MNRNKANTSLLRVVCKALNAVENKHQIFGEGWKRAWELSNGVKQEDCNKKYKSKENLTLHIKNKHLND